MRRLGIDSLWQLLHQPIFSLIWEERSMAVLLCSLGTRDLQYSSHELSKGDNDKCHWAL